MVKDKFASLFGIIIIFSLILVGCATEENYEKENVDSETQDQKKPELSIGCAMASINAGTELSENDPMVAVFNKHLSSIQKKTGVKQNVIGDMLVYAWQKVAQDQYKLDMTLLDLTKGTDTSIPDDAPMVQGKESLSFTINAFIIIYKDQQG